MKQYLIYFVAVFTVLNSFAANNTTITFDKNTYFSKSIKFETFFVDKNNTLTAGEVVKLGDAFQNVVDLKNTKGRHWSMLEVKNSESKDIFISINKGSWDQDSELYILNPDHSLIKLDTHNFNGFNFAFKPIPGDKSKLYPSRNVSVGILKQSAINLVIKHPLDFSPDAYDSIYISKYAEKSERDRGTLYIEGLMTGGIFSIFIFSIFVALIYRDTSNTLFCAWLLFSFFSTLNDFTISDSGSRLGEFIIDFNNLTSPANKKLIDWGLYYYYPLVLAICIFQVYIGSLLKIKDNYPKLFRPHIILASLIYIQIFNIITSLTFGILGYSGFDNIERFFDDQIHLGMVSGYAQLIYQISITFLCIDQLRRGNTWIIFFLAAMVVGIANGPLRGLIYPYMDPLWILMGQVLGISSELFSNIAYPFFTLIQAIILTCGVASRLKFSQGQLAKATEENQRILIEQNQTLEVKVKERTKDLQLQTDKTEKLMLNILPNSIADRLKQGETDIADKHLNTTILFSDLVGFSKMSSQKSPEELVFLLNDLFKRFDIRATELGLEKIKTIGDAYMVAGGLPTVDDSHAIQVTKMALGMHEDLANFNKEHGLDFEMRIGINSGPVVAGIIGHSKFSYDLWGNTVNTASRMESTSIPGKVQVSPSTYELIKTHFEVRAHQEVECKGLGLIMTYFVAKST